MSDIKLSVDGIEYEPTGKCCVEGNDIVIRYGMHQVIYKPKEKDMPKYWEILSFTSCYEGINDVIFEINNSGVFHPKEGFRKTYTLSYLLSQPTAKIHSVKRLTDNSVFNVGDETDKGKITMFTIQKDNLYVHIDHLWYYINHIQKVKPKVPLFSCLDGHPNFEGDYVYPVCKSNFKIDQPFTTSAAEKNLPTVNDFWHYFSSEEKRNEWLTLNKPIEVSFQELNTIINRPCNIRDYETVDNTVCEIKDFFKSKINP